MDTHADKDPETRVPLQARLRPEPEPTRPCSCGQLSSDTLSSSHAALLKHERASSGGFQRVFLRARVDLARETLDMCIVTARLFPGTCHAVLC